MARFTPGKRTLCREGWFLCFAGGDWVIPVYSSPLAVPGAGGTDKQRVGHKATEYSAERSPLAHQPSQGVCQQAGDQGDIEPVCLVLQPHLWRFINLIAGGLRRPLEPSASIVTATCLLSLGTAPARPGQTQFCRVWRQGQGDLQQTPHLWDGQFSQRWV